MAPRTMRFEEITAPGGRRPISRTGNEKARGRSPGAGGRYIDKAWLALALQDPRLPGVAIESAQSVVRRRRRKPVGILRIDTEQSG
jgi:hypothetical protein